MTTTEMNKAIGEYDGWEFGQYFVDEAQYHLSFDWLMPVWFKIQQAGADEGYAFKKYHEAFHAGIDHQSIEKCHKAVYEAVLWLKGKEK